jgi:hypothetical protein
VESSFNDSTMIPLFIFGIWNSRFQFQAWNQWSYFGITVELCFN